MTSGSDAAIDAVFFAQTHVQRPDSPYFRLVGNRDALVKVHVVSPNRAKAPQVAVRISLNGDTTRIALEGPGTLPESICTEPGKVVHRFEDCFTGTIPAKWIGRGLRVAVEAGEQALDIGEIEVGAPTVLDMTAFDIHFFEYEDVDFPPGWEDALMVRRPVAELRTRRIPRIVFEEIVIPPCEGCPATRCISADDYRAKTGHDCEGHWDAALGWATILQKAGGQSRLSLFFVNIANIHSGGMAWDFVGMGNLRRFPVMHHELGHAFNIDHLVDEPDYPYKDTMHGIVGHGPHVGPTWGFDPRVGLQGAPEGKPYFISPVIPEKTLRGSPGEWKNDCLQGGSEPFEEGHLLNMYADWTVHRMQEYLEKKVARWSDERGAYVTWDDDKAEYDKIVKPDGVALPVERDVEVLSIIASASAVTPEANFVYPVIGPYVSGLIDTFDPDVPEDRERALSVHGGKTRCDVSLRIVQGGITKTFMLPIEWRPDDDPLDYEKFQTAAVNVPARDGDVTRAELLLTPEAGKNGAGANPTVLYSRRY